mmetsp:Transcript_25911/g.65309  ORF Transcript_25911/g.65309 Transcript_25911/m.65309 type:complete len:185 (+) Transcript_25911:35-589(+)
MEAPTGEGAPQERRPLPNFVLAMAGCAMLALLYVGTQGSPTVAGTGHVTAAQMLAMRQANVEQLANATSAPAAAAAGGKAAAAAAAGGKPTGVAAISTGKEVQKSVIEAFEDKPTKDNSHYVSGYNDKEVHLAIIFILMVVPAVFYFAFKTQEKINARGGRSVVDTDAVRARASQAIASMKNRK